MASPAPDDFGFTYQASKHGEVSIHRWGRPVTTLRGRKAQEFLARLEGSDPAAQQRLMARVTGNYKRGNERAAGSHPRNRH
jgi:hypothetical protein